MGRIKLILKAENQHPGKANEIVVIERFTVLNSRHPNLDMPVLSRELDEENAFIAVDPRVGSFGYLALGETNTFAVTQTILFIFNAQHDCFYGECPIAPIEKVYQDRILVVDKLEMGVKHTDNRRYVVNMHALHNANLLRKALPRHLTEPHPYTPDRTAFHSSLAAGLQVSGPAKRAESAAKAAATRARKRGERVVDEVEDSDMDSE